MNREKIKEILAKIECLPNECDCPYYVNGFCTLENPYQECDDLAACAME